jgi:hypothetical protein
LSGAARRLPASSDAVAANATARARWKFIRRE